MPAAQAGMCANEQGKFLEYQAKLFENQHALQADQLKQYAADLGLDADAFNSCFDSGKFQDAVSEDYLDGQKLGVTGTPAFFINGRFLSGAQPFEAFQALIEEELQL